MKRRFEGDHGPGVSFGPVSIGNIFKTSVASEEGMPHDPPEDSSASEGEPSSSATWSILTSSRSDVGDSDVEAPAALPHPANYPVLTMIECAKLYFDAVKIPPHFFSPPPGHDKYVLSTACTGAGTAAYCMFGAGVQKARKDLCAVTGTEFEEVVASENDRQTQWLLKTHYKCDHIFNDCAGGHQGGHCIVHDRFCIPEVSTESDSEDMYVAGPPCQPFSKLNIKRRDPGYYPFKDDPNSRPIVEVARHIRDRKPKTFAIEEVATFNQTWPAQYQGAFFEKYQTPMDYLLFGEEGGEKFGLELIPTKYHIAPLKVRSRDFGSPQCRLRLYIVGVRQDVMDVGDYNSMIQFFNCYLRSVHEYKGIDDVVAWVSTLGVPHVEVASLGKEAQQELSAKSQKQLQETFLRLGMTGEDSEPYVPHVPAAAVLTAREKAVLDISWKSIRKELMAIQGFNPERFDMESRSYGFWNRIAGNGMTTSVLSAILFSFMCYALPTSSGKALLGGPHPTSLLPSSTATPDDYNFHRDYAKTLVMGEDEEEESGSERANQSEAGRVVRVISESD